MNLLTKSGGIVKLDTSKEIARGGEGKIIDADTEVAKIYLPGIKAITEEKFNDLSELKSSIFVKPEMLLYDSKHVIVGFLMKKVPTDHFPILSLFNKTFCVREGITDKVKENVAEKLVDAMKFAHSKGIIIGDFNPYNILVNKQGSVYLIDVDSYGTPHSKHTGVMFDEVRDYLYNGIVNKESDYFALSVIVFNLYTYVHPFKGIHKKVPKMSERMYKKLPIFKADPDLFAPKCYSPITNQVLQQQFSDLYIDGKRFIINPSTVTVVQAPVKVVNLVTQELMVKPLFQGPIIRTFYGFDKLGIITSVGGFIYSVSTKGMYSPLVSLLAYPEDQIFFAENYTYILSEKILYLITSSGRIIVKDFSSEKYLKVRQYEENLVIITDTMKYEYLLTQVFNNTVSVKVSNIFGGKFANTNGLFMRVDGSTMLYYNKNKVINSVVMTRPIKDIYQVGNTGIIKYLENDVMHHKYITINNLQIEEFDCSLDDIRYYDKLTQDLMIVPQDDELELVHTANMATIAKYQCDVVSADSVIHCCKAGIVIVNPDGIYLANKK